MDAHILHYIYYYIFGTFCKMKMETQCTMEMNSSFRMTETQCNMETHAMDHGQFNANRNQVMNKILSYVIMYYWKATSRHLLWK